MPDAEHITDRVANAVVDDTSATHVPGPSTNPATNLLINDIALRSIGRLSRQTVEKALLGKQYGRDFAKEAVENRSTLHVLATYAVTRLATNSLPGLALVSGGLIVKTLFDRSQSRRKARHKGTQQLRDQADLAD